MRSSGLGSSVACVRTAANVAMSALVLVTLAACTDYAVPPKESPTASVTTSAPASVIATVATSASAIRSSASASKPRPPAAHVDFTSGVSIIAALNRGGYRCTGTTANTKVIVAKTDHRCTHAATNDTSVTTYASPAALANVQAGFGALLDKSREVCGPAWCVTVANHSSAAKVSAILKP